MAAEADPYADEESRHKLSGDIDVIIVGAGLTGLISGRDLALRGYKVCVMESSHRVGGRVYSTVFPRTTHGVDLGGEWYDSNVHYDMVAEAARYNLTVSDPQFLENEKSAYNFTYPGRKVITKATIPETDQLEYKRVTDLLNHDMCLLAFAKGFQDRALDYLDVTWHEYVVNRLKCHHLMLDFHLAMAFNYMSADAKSVSAVAVMHFLCGFGSVEEISNTRPREGYPFEKPHMVRIAGGMGTLCDRLVDDIIAHGGEIRLNHGVGTVVCEPVPEKPCPRYCPKCARYTYPMCSLHGPRVIVADAMGRQTRARACILAVPLNCLPCFKFTPPLVEALKHASEMCNIGEITKSYVLSSRVGAAVDQVQSWPGATMSWVLARFVEKLNKNTKEFAPAAIAKAPPSMGRVPSSNGFEGSIALKNATPTKSALLGKSSRDRGASRADTKSVGSGSMDSLGSAHKGVTDVGEGEEEVEGDEGNEGNEGNEGKRGDQADSKHTPRSDGQNAGSGNVSEDGYSDAKGCSGAKGECGGGSGNDEGGDDNDDDDEHEEDGYDKLSIDGTAMSPDDKSVSTAHHEDDESIDDPDDSSAVTEVTESTQSTRTTAALSVMGPGNTQLLDKHDPFTTFMQLAEEGEVRYKGTGMDDDQNIGSLKDEREKVEEEFDQHGYKVRAYAVIGVVGPQDELGDKGQKLAPLLRRHHPTSRLHKIITHNWQRDRHLRGSQMAIRAGSTHLFASAVEAASRPWETKNLIVAGSDVTDLWTGWLEGAVNSGHKAADTMTAFLNPPVPVANFTSRYTVGADPRRT